MDHTASLHERSLFVVIVTLTIAVGAFAQAGSPDPGFGWNGMVVFPLSILTALNAVAIQSDGKILVAGAGAGNTSAGDVLIRLNTDGSLDTTFASGGTLPSRLRIFPPAFRVGDPAGGKIVAARGGVLQLVRLLPDGTLDRTFGVSGPTADLRNGDGTFGSMNLQSDGKILVSISCECGEPSQNSLHGGGATGCILWRERQYQLSSCGGRC